MSSSHACRQTDQGRGVEKMKNEMKTAPDEYYFISEEEVEKLDQVARKYHDDLVRYIS